MARQLRVEYPGAIYHVINRGDRRESIFEDDQDRESFLTGLAEACGRTGWEVHALCLMGNHFHLVVETPQGNLVSGMKWLLGTYTGRYNRRHKQFGHLFSGRYKAVIVDGSGDGYFKTVCDYVHLNPVRAKMLTESARLSEYRWSSWPEYLKTPGKRWPWLRVDRLLGEYGIPRDSAAGRRRLEEAMEERRKQENETDYKGLRRGWCFGGETFREELLGQMEERMGPEHYGSARQETAEAKAERLVEEGLKRLKWRAADLALRARGDPRKVALAARLRAETMMTVKWIAARLRMGTSGYVNHLLYQRRKAGKGKTANVKISRTDPFTEQIAVQFPLEEGTHAEIAVNAGWGDSLNLIGGYLNVSGGEVTAGDWVEASGLIPGTPELAAKAQAATQAIMADH